MRYYQSLRGGRAAMTDFTFDRLVKHYGSVARVTDDVIREWQQIGKPNLLHELYSCDPFMMDWHLADCRDSYMLEHARLKGYNILSCGQGVYLLNIEPLTEVELITYHHISERA